MNRQFVIGCFYTPEYETIFRENLQASCERLGLPLRYLPLPTMHGWTSNCGLKPTAILEMMSQHPDLWIIFVDVDAQIRKIPPLDELPPCDLACRYLQRVDKTPEILSGTLVISPRGRDIVEAWQSWQEKCPNDWDQRNLAKAIQEFRPSRILDLDERWCNVHLLHEYHPTAIQGPEEEAFIVHGQASRRMRRLIT